MATSALRKAVTSCTTSCQSCRSNGGRGGSEAMGGGEERRQRPDHRGMVGLQDLDPLPLPGAIGGGGSTGTGTGAGEAMGDCGETAGTRS